MAAGAAWMILLRLADRLIGLVSLAILARLLAPEDFGIVALAAAIVAIVEVFGALNLEAALIRDRAADRAAFDTAWTLRALIAAVLAGVLLVVSPLAAHLMEDDRLVPVIVVLAAATLLHGFENIGTVEFQRRLEFRRDFLYRFAGRLAGTLVAIVCAIVWFDYRALVAGTVARAATLVVLSYLVHPYRPRPSFAVARHIFAFSRWVLLDNLLAGLNQRLAHFVVAKITGVEQLAFFTTAAEIANLATTEIQAPIRRAIFPGFAAMAGEIERLRRAYVQSLAVLFAIGAPIAAGIAITAGEIVLLLLGPRWMPVIALVQILALAGIANALRTGSHVVYLALDRPQLATRLTLLALAITLPALIAGAMLAGVEGAAWALVVRAVLLLVADYAILARLLELRLGALVGAAWRPFAGILALAVALGFLRTALPDATTTGEAFVPFVALVAAGAVVYVATVFVLWAASGRPDGAETATLAAVARLTTRRSGRAARDAH